MKKICFVYPYITSYIIPLIEGMSENDQVDFFFSPNPSRAGFGVFNYGDTNNLNWIEVETFTPFGEKFGMYQRGVISHIIRSRPEAVIIFAKSPIYQFLDDLNLGTNS